MGLLGAEYGVPDRTGVSPTHREFLRATAIGKPRLIYLKGDEEYERDPKMRALIREIDSQLVRRRFRSIPELTTALYASLVEYLIDRSLVRVRPFDAAGCRGATMDDVSSEKVEWFLSRAHHNRNYVLDDSTPYIDALTHLNLLEGDIPTNAAMLLFGKKPQRFLVSSEVKCMHFHGTQVRKPIPSYQIYKGTAFELADHSVDFVMSKLNLWVGTRDRGADAPVEYEIPQSVVAEAIVNAIAHRDYASNASVQVMLFADRLEVWNPGNLPPALTLASLRTAHPSIPTNPLLAEPLYLANYIEKAGSGTLDMIAVCVASGLPEPEFRLEAGSFVLVLRRTRSGTEQVTEQATEQVMRLLMVFTDVEASSSELMSRLRLSHRPSFYYGYLRPALEAGHVERTIPDQPRSSRQKYRLTDKGRTFLSQLRRDA